MLSLRLELIDIIYGLITILVALSFHEFAHAYVAYYMGDPTAKYQGRLSINFIDHMDPMGTFVLIFTLFFSPFVLGWGKPVPVNYNNFHDRKKGMLYVAFAGPMANFALAFMAGIVFRFFLSPLNLPMEPFIKKFFLTFGVINVVLGGFNLIPIPPLDGSKIMMGILPSEWSYRYSQLENNPVLTMIIFMIIIITPILQFILMPIISIYNLLFF